MYTYCLLVFVDFIGSNNYNGKRRRMINCALFLSLKELLIDIVEGSSSILPVTYHLSLFLTYEYVSIFFTLYVLTYLIKYSISKSIYEFSPVTTFAQYYSHNYCDQIQLINQIKSSTGRYGKSVQFHPVRVFLLPILLDYS